MNDDAGCQARPEGPFAIDTEQAQAANYIAELAAELVTLACKHRLDSLAYILRMAAQEAENVSRPKKP